MNFCNITNVRYTTVMDTKESILAHTAQLLAHEGVAGTSMRKVAAAVGIEASVIYSHFADKQTLLRSTRIYITSSLDEKMRGLPLAKTAYDQLKTSIYFQFTHRVLIVALLQYFMSAREDFQKTENGYVPTRAYRHMTEIIKNGIAEGRYISSEIDHNAKISTHLINGYLMEYFDHEVSEAEIDRLVETIVRFIDRSLANKEYVAC